MEAYRNPSKEKIIMARMTPKMEIAIPHNELYGLSDVISRNQKVHQGLVFFIKAIIPNFANNITSSIITPETILSRN